MNQRPLDPENVMLISAGKICPYCGDCTQFIDSKEVYGTSYGMIYMCFLCDAYVGVHRGTTKALGRLADVELRQWKKEAHAWFDPIWQKWMAGGLSKFEARSNAYIWLSDQMGVPADLAHIGMFDVDQCKRVVEICKQYYSTQSKVKK